MLRERLPRLQRAYGHLLEGELSPEARRLLEENLPSLSLAEAFLVKTGLERLPIQVAVVGPTQVGKSTVVNLLLGETLASVSPLAGWTVHATLFLQGVEAAPWLTELFPGYEIVPATGLSRRKLNQVGLASSSSRSSTPRVVWDTPDFDSLRAERYRTIAVKVAGFADLLVVVVSKEKYADASVWHFLELVEPLSQPILVCINKVREGQEALLEGDFRKQWQRRFGKRPLRLLLLPYREDPTALDREALSRTVEEMGRTFRRRPLVQERALEERFLKRWLEPARRQEEALHLWQTWLEEAEREAIELYRRDFLDHLHLYDTLQRVMAELLVLLEVPGIARPMFHFRRIITWPFRWFVAPRRGGGASPELAVLKSGADHFLMTLQKRLLTHKPHPLGEPLFRQLADRLKAEQSAFRASFERAIHRYYESFRPQVERTAEELYRKLQERPALLNSLRASRTFADTAALALAIQTSGIGPHDLVVAPAFLAFTSLLAEGALGKFLDQKVAQLKARQLGQVVQLFRESLVEPLRALPDRLDLPRWDPTPKPRYGLITVR